mgnify:CR=1 FL=1
MTFAHQPRAHDRIARRLAFSGLSLARRAARFEDNAGSFRLKFSLSADPVIWRIPLTIFGSIALALAISSSPSEIAPLRFLASPRPYSDEVNLGLILERGVKIGDRVLGLPALQIDQPAAVEAHRRSSGAAASASLQSFSCRLQVADHGAGPAAVVEGFDVLGVQPQRGVEVLDGKIVGALAGIDLSAPVERAGVVGIVGELVASGF